MSGTHLTACERGQIEALHTLGYSLRAIANQLGRCYTAISRELRRTSAGKPYRGELAHTHYQQRTQPCRPRLGFYRAG